MTEAAKKPKPNPEAERVSIESRNLLAELGALVITDEATYRRAGEVLRAVKALRQEVERVWAPVVKAAHDAHKTATRARGEQDAPLAQAEARLKGAIGSYAQEQERIARVAAAQAAAAAAKAEEDARIEEAAALEAAGEVEEAERVLMAPPPPPPPPVRATPRLSGVSVSEVWRARCVDLPALVAAVAAGHAPASLLAFDQRAGDALAAATRGASRVPGVSFDPEKRIAVQGGV